MSPFEYDSVALCLVLAQVLIMILIAPLGTAMFVRNRRFHGALAIAFTLWLFGFTARFGARLAG